MMGLLYIFAGIGFIVVALLLGLLGWCVAEYEPPEDDGEDHECPGCGEEH